jgi:hypothetical protein
LFILGIIGIVIWLMVRNRRQKHLKQPEIIPPVITKPAWQLALDELSALQALQLPEKQEFIVFHFRLSDIMKQYLEAELGFNAKEMTTREIRQHFNLAEQHADAAKGQVLCSGLPTPTPNSLPNCATSINVEQHADAAKTQATANSLIPQDRYPALHSILPAEQKALIQWLEKNDRVKFAKYVPDTETCYQSLDWAMQWFKLQSLNASANAGQTHSHA